MASEIQTKPDADDFIDEFDYGFQTNNLKLSAIACMGFRHLGDEEKYGHFAGILTGRIMQDFFDLKLPPHNSRIAAIVALENIPDLADLADILSGIILGFDESQESDKYH